MPELAQGVIEVVALPSDRPVVGATPPVERSISAVIVLPDPNDFAAEDSAKIVHIGGIGSQVWTKIEEPENG